MTSQEQFNHDYLFVRKELLAGRFTLQDVKLWMKDRERKMVEEMSKKDGNFQKLVTKRMSHNPERELEQIKKLFSEGGEKEDE